MFQPFPYRPTPVLFSNKQLIADVSVLDGFP